jgi:hypothetical protein
LNHCQREDNLDAEKEAAMLELTDQQIRSLEDRAVTPPRVVNPRTNETFVLLRIDEYERLTDDMHDDSPRSNEIAKKSNRAMLRALEEIEMIRRDMNPHKDKADYLREARGGAMYGLDDEA